MDNGTKISVTDGVAQIALDAGPSARLSLHLLSALDVAFTQLAKDDAVQVIVFRGKGPTFPSGVTDPQGGGDDRGNLLSDLCLRIERCVKPVIAVMNGVVVGGGVELALAAHYRLVHAHTRLGFPNARLGLVPHAGATQRLPRLVGADMSLELLLGGTLVPITKGKLTALADELFEDAPDDAITRFVAAHPDGLAPRPTAERRSGFTDAKAYQAALTRMRASVEASPEVAPRHILSAVEAAILLPIDAGLAYEQAAAEDCADTDQSKALAHLFHAEQAVSTHTRRTDLPDISTVAVLGGSANAVQIVLAALDADLGVNWVIKDPAQQRDSVGHVRAVVQEAVRSGKLNEERAKRSLDALRYGDGAQMIDGADIALRATRGQRGVHLPPQMPVAHCLPGTDPRLALQFFPTAKTARLVEVILGPQSTEGDRLAGLALARRLNKLAVVETTSGMGLYDRLIQILLQAADSLVDLGQSPFTVDAAMRAWGMVHPPYELADSIGLEAVSRHKRAEGCQNWADLLVQLGRKGRVDGRGFYTYAPSSPPKPDAEILQRIYQRRVPQSDMPAEQIARLVLGAMASEGARALRDGVVARAGDIDVVSVFTQLVPNWHGGVMHAVGEGGLLRTARAMEGLDHPDRALWTPDPVFGDLIKYGRRFDDL